LAIQEDGSLWAWGDNTSGELGQGTSGFGSYSLIPLKVTDHNDWVFVSAGVTHNMAIRENGTLWGWGSHYRGQLGNGTNIGGSTVPTQIGTGHTWAFASTGETYTMAIRQDGTLWAWGDNFFAQLGNGEGAENYQTFEKHSPVQIGAPHTWQSVSAAGLFTVAIRSDGSLWSWGGNEFGQLGLVTPGTRKIPTQVQPEAALDWTSTATATSPHALAIKSDGTLWSWGGNGSGQLGNGITTGAIVTSPERIIVKMPE